MWACRQEAWPSEGPLIKYTRFADEETDGRRGPAAELSGTGTFASLLQPRVGSTMVHLILSIGFPQGLPAQRREHWPWVWMAGGLQAYVMTLEAWDGEWD